MSRSKSNIADEFRGWTKEEREFCIKSYYLNNENTFAVMRAYWIKFRELKSFIKEKMPSDELIKKWVRVHEQNERVQKVKEAEEEQKKYSNKLSRTQWGRKTGENRIIRTESIDVGEQNQAIKWKQRDIKWSGPRAVEKEPIVPVVEKRLCIKYHRKENYFEHYYEKSDDEKRMPDPMKKQLLQEKFKGKVLELMESLNACGHAARASAFVSLRAELQRRAVDHLLAAHRATLGDHVSRALRRGKDEERKAAAAIAPLLALQIGEEGTEQFVREVRPALTAAATDKSASLDTRTECCSSLAVLCYLMDDDVTEILEVMRMYETIFSGSYLKDDGSVKVSGAAVEEGAWHAAALDGWALLFPLLSPNHALSLLNQQAPSFAKLGELLEAVSLEVRMAAGGALAIAYETVTDDDNSDNALTAHVDALLPRLTELARDSDRFRAKKDLRIQRATFRDILKYFEEGEQPSTSAHIGRERAEWSSWSGGAAHAALASALGGALQVLAPRSARLRAALALPDNPPAEYEQQEESKRSQEKPKQLSQKKFEMKVLDLMESLDAPEHAARTSAFMSLHEELQRRGVDHLLAAHRATLADHVSRALRKGKRAEWEAAAAIQTLLALQSPAECEQQLQEKPEKSKKLQRHLQNRAASKARHFTRNQNRDKRSEVLAV